VRVREELAAAGVPTVAICRSADAQAAVAARAAGTRVVVGDVSEPDTWEAAGLEHARAVGVLGPNDLENLGAALLVADRRRDVKIVARLFSPDLSDGIGKILGARGTALSEIELAGPLLVQAAISGQEGQRVSLAGRVLEVAETTPDDPKLVVALCDADDPDLLLPRAPERAVLGLVDRAPRRRPRRTRRQKAAAALKAVPARAYLLLAAIVGVFAISVATFAISDHLSAIDAVYFTATTMATVGYGDVNLLGAPDWLKLYDVALMAVSAILLASILALLTDALVSTRIERALGRFPRPKHEHMVVCGLGKTGAKVIQALHDLQIPCVAVEQDANAIGVELARRLEIPVVFADARQPGTLQSVHVSTARALLAITSDDLANLECGLTARRHHPEIRVVLRIFDPRLAERLDQAVELDITRSMSALAAPQFAAALLGAPRDSRWRSPACRSGFSRPS
jgi:Trk K+ transport system NAD-binding subunit